MQLSVILEDWLLLRSAGLKPRTVESYRDLLNRYILPEIGAATTESITAAEVTHLLAQICASGKTRTAELVFVILRCALRYVPSIDWSRIRRPVHRQQRPEPWGDDQIRRYMTALQGHKHGLALSLGLVLGLRRGEICGLRWGDVDFERGVVHIVNQRVRLKTGIVDSSPKSASSVRSIPVPSPLLAALRRSRGTAAAYVCPISPWALDRAHRELVKDIGLSYIPLHGLRHSMATACLRHGGDMRCLQSILGHSSYTVTADIYAHPDYDMLMTAIDAAAAACYTV